VPNRDDDHADDSDPDAQKLFARGLFAQEGRGEQNCEQHLGLQDQGGEAGRHSEVQCEVDERELADGHEHSDEDHVPPPDSRGADEEHGRECNENEPHCGEQQRGDVGQAGVDDHEVGAPDNRHKDGQGGVFGLHVANTVSPDPELPANVSWLYYVESLHD